jgi:hypothetical protein
MNALAQKAVELIGQLQAASQHWTQLAIQTEQASAIGAICVGFVLLAISATLFITVRRIERNPFDMGSCLQLASVIAVVFSGMLLLTRGVGSVHSTRNWP